MGAERDGAACSIEGAIRDDRPGTPLRGCAETGRLVVSLLMKGVALSAHFDGRKIELDEPYQLSENSRLVVVVLPAEDERQEWSRLAARQLSRAYGEDEPEYTQADLRP
jgi:hypothetical protein